jgi:hypothetical protein
MNLPYQAPAVDREDRLGSAVDANVAPAFWGALASTLAPVAIKGVSGLLKNLF